MADKPLTASQNPHSPMRTFFASLWCWDLWVALVVATGVGVVWFTADIGLPWAWGLGTALAAGVYIVFAMALWQTVLALIIGTPYGELLHTVDPHRDEARMPFMVTAIVGAVTLVLSSALLVVDTEASSRLAVGILLVPTALVAVWGLLASLSISLHYRTHRKFAASADEAKSRLDEAEAKARSASGGA